MVMMYGESLCPGTIPGQGEKLAGSTPIYSSGCRKSRQTLNLEGSNEARVIIIIIIIIIIYTYIVPFS